MQNFVNLSLNDIKLLGGGFIWFCLNNKLPGKSNLDFSKSNFNSFLEFSSNIGKVNHPDLFKDAKLTKNVLFINSKCALTGKKNIDLLIKCLNIFFNDLKSKPEEVESLTGAQFSFFSDLLSRLKVFLN